MYGIITIIILSCYLDDVKYSVETSLSRVQNPIWKIDKIFKDSVIEHEPMNTILKVMKNKTYFQCKFASDKLCYNNWLSWYIIQLAIN